MLNSPRTRNGSIREYANIDFMVLGDSSINVNATIARCTAVYSSVSHQFVVFIVTHPRRPKEIM